MSNVRERGLGGEWFGLHHVFPPHLMVGRLFGAFGQVDSPGAGRGRQGQGPAVARPCVSCLLRLCPPRQAVARNVLSTPRRRFRV